MPKRKRKVCKEDGCTSFARGSTNLCVAHGGGKRCKEDGCTSSARGNTNLCVAHGGGKRCQEEGCNKSAQDNTNLCIAHGGGKRCKEDGCTSSALGNTNLCVAHGGGKRCKEDGCTSSAQGNTNLCIAHGGGKRCKEDGCTSSAQGNTNLCVAHGGGKRCQKDGCTSSALGITNLCQAHGGGKRCSRNDVHQFDDLPPIYYNTINNEDLCYSCTLALYPNKTKLVLRKEHVILAEVQRRIPELEAYFVSWDCAIPGGCSLHRPDMLWNMYIFWFAIKVDEDGHDQKNGKYEFIQRSMDNRPGILLRINPDERGSHMCIAKRTRIGDKTYQASKHFHKKMDDVERVIRDVILQKLKSNVVPKKFIEIKLFF